MRRRKNIIVPLGLPILLSITGEALLNMPYVIEGVPLTNEQEVAILGITNNARMNLQWWFL